MIGSKQIQELPLADGTAYMLTRLAPGITDSWDLQPRNSQFGYVNQDRNNPRDIQLGLRLTF